MWQTGIALQTRIVSRWALLSAQIESGADRDRRQLLRLVFEVTEDVARARRPHVRCSCTEPTTHRRHCAERCNAGACMGHGAWGMEAWSNGRGMEAWGRRRAWRE